MSGEPASTPPSDQPYAKPKTFLCPNDKNPVAYPALIQEISVPDDVGPLFDLIEGRLNTAVCPLCRERIAISTAVVVFLAEAKLMLVHTAGVDSLLSEEVRAQFPADLRIKTASDYNELKRLVVPELDRWIVPTGSALFGEAFRGRSRADQIATVTPFFLRVFKSQIDGFLPPFLQYPDATPSEERERVTRDLYAQTVADQLERLTLEAARTRRMLELRDDIIARVPAECLTSEVLAKIAARCTDPVGPREDAHQTAIGFRDELLNAEAHAHAGVENPRAKTWAAYVAGVWSLSRLPNVELDPQMLLTPAIAQRTLRFRDLWDAAGPYIQRLIDQDDTSPRDLVGYVSDMATQFGFVEDVQRLTDETGGLVKPQPENDDQRAKLVNAYRETLGNEARWNESPTQSVAIGMYTARVLQSLITQSATDEALDLVDELFDEAMQAQDYAAVESIASHSAEILNRYELYAPAADLLARTLDVVQPTLNQLAPERAVSFFNELGNAARYAHHYEEALDSYNLASEFVPFIADDQQRARDAQVLRRNRAIVLRDLGRFAEALTILRAEERDRPDDPDVHHSLSVLFLRVGRLADALTHVERALDTYKGTPRSPIRLNYLMTRGNLRALLGEVGPGVSDLLEALGTFPEHAYGPRSRVMSAIFAIPPVGEEIANVRTRLRDEAGHLLSEAGPALSPSHRVTLESQVAGDLLRVGGVAAAKHTLEKLASELRATKSEMPWQLSHQLGELYLRGDDMDRSWEWLQRAVSRIEREVPAGSDAAFAPSWLADKAALQEAATTVALRRARRNAAPAASEQLLEMFDFANGREIAARLGENAGGRKRRTLADRFAACVASVDVPVRAFFFLEAEGHVHLASVAGDSSVASEPLVSIAEAVRARRQFIDAMSRVNPASPHRVDDRLGAWHALADRIGRAMSDSLADGERVCLLAGRALTGLPLHLVPVAEGVPLIKRHIVTFAPNFAVLLARPAPHSKQRLTVVSVPKAGDSGVFLERARRATTLLQERITDCDVLEGIAGSRAAVLEALRDSAELVFLCHGRHADRDRGVGICISDGAHLPPALIAVRDVPDHLRFLLTWEDIERAPGTVVSIACSSGLSDIGPAGVRFGLEQTLFSGGTRTLVSPLWDIDQQGALGWIEEFYRARMQPETRGIAAAYRDASLALSTSFPHFYHWGCFTLSGTLAEVAQ